MKKSIAYFFIVIYSVLLLRPAMPFVSDALAHVFWYSQHIATVHFENGKYHVHYQFMDESGKSLPGKNGQALKTENFTGFHIITALVFDFSVTPVQKDLYRNETPAILLVYPGLNDPPPKA